MPQGQPSVVPDDGLTTRQRRNRPLVMVHTGDGKGKSTAAFGVLMRGVARGWTPCVIQFVKSDRWKVGEESVARRLGVRWLKGGDGFSWESPDLATSEALARNGMRQQNAKNCSSVRTFDSNRKIPPEKMNPIGAPS